MNREIKYRAWLKEKKKMVNVFLMSLTEKWIGYQIFYKEEKKKKIEFSDSENFELMQYTGLKDKNGKEIYEGDVIKLIYFRDGRRRETGKVVFLNHQASFGIIDRDGNEYPLYRNTAEQIEIIGNIYENFELTEKGNNYGKQNREND